MSRYAAIAFSVALVAGAAMHAERAVADPTLKGPLAGELRFDPDEPGFAVLTAKGHLTLMGRVEVYGEFLFAPGSEPGFVEGAGVAVIVAANGDLVVSDVLWLVDPDGRGELEFRWPDQITLSDDGVVHSTGRLRELPFAGIRGTSPNARNGDITICMTGAQVIILAP